MVLTCLAIVVVQAGVVEAGLQEVLPLHGLQLLYKLLLLRPELRQGPGHLRLWEEEAVTVILACRRHQDYVYRHTTPPGHYTVSTASPWRHPATTAALASPVVAQLVRGCSELHDFPTQPRGQGGEGHTAE